MFFLFLFRIKSSNRLSIDSIYLKKFILENVQLKTDLMSRYWKWHHCIFTSTVLIECHIRTYNSSVNRLSNFKRLVNSDTYLSSSEKRFIEDKPKMRDEMGRSIGERKTTHTRNEVMRIVYKINSFIRRYRK